MKPDKTKIPIFVSVIVAVIYTVVLIVWISYNPHRNLSVQVPGADNRPEGTARTIDDVRIGEHFMQYETLETTLTGKWTGFRGSDYDNIARKGEKLKLKEGDFPALWEVKTGEGHAAPAIYEGRVYLLDYDESLSSDMLRCFSLETGKELWRRWYRVPMKRNHGFSRTIPVVDKDYIVTIGPQGHVMCCHPITGELLWTLDMQKNYLTEIPFWYTGQCPLVVGDELILAPVGDSILMAGYDVMTGEKRWETPNESKFKMSHSSILPMTVNGQKTYVYMGIGGVCGVAAEGEKKGNLLWSVTTWQPSVIAPSAIKLNSSDILLVAGYGAGGATLRVAGSPAKATIVEQHRPIEGIACEQQTPVIYNGKIYSVLPKDGGGARGKLVSYDPSDLRRTVWQSGADERFGLGPFMIVGDVMFVFKDNGELFMYRMGGDEPTLIRSQRILDGVDAWGPMAYADGYLIVRDAHHVVCLQVED